MKRIERIMILFILSIFLGAGLLFANGKQESASAAVPQVQIVHWSHWVTNNKWYEPYWADLAQQFNALHPDVNFSIQVVAIPYEGYTAKYSSAFEAGKGPGMFNGMAHQWAGNFHVADPMPKDIADKLDKIIIPASKAYGVFDGQRYGIPVEGGNFMMMYINVDRFKEAGLDPNNPPKTYDELLADAKKLTVYDKNGNILKPGYGIRYKGEPLGIADKLAPFSNAWGAEWYSWEKKTADGYLNSPQSVAALQFYADLVQKYKVSSLTQDNPAAVFGQGLAGIIFRESWYAAWLSQNAPDIHYKVYPLPREKMESGFGNNFPWSIMVNKNLKPTDKKWLWEFFRWYVNSPAVRKAHYVKSEMLPPFNDILDDPVFTSMPVFDAWKVMANGRAAPTYYNPPAQEILNVIGAATLSAMYGKKTAQASLDDATKQVDAILARYK
jgi:multiple sugar transport system substrate-binding protein